MYREEKTELLTECKEELEHANSLVSKIKAENTELLAEARKAKAYRDEADAIREKAERADKLEAEAQRYRERLADTDFYRVRVVELREDNRVLLETREMLEAQLARSRQRAEHVLELEAEVLQLKQAINDVTLERDADRERMGELIDENVQLQQVTKQALQENSSITLDSDLEESNSGDNSLSEQLTNNAQARALKLELENRKLLSTIDSLKESNFHESSKKLLEIEKEKKKLELKHEQLQENFERLRQQNRELDDLFKASIQENRKLQSSFDSNKIIADRQAQDIQNERIKIEELEKNIDSLTKEKQRIQILTDNIKKRADDAEKSLGVVSEQLEAVQEVANKAKEYKTQVDESKEKILQTEKEIAAAQREVAKYKETNEVKDRTIDEHHAQIEIIKKELQRALKDSDSLAVQLEKQQENEQKLQELSSQTAIATVTIDNLQKDLISHKLTNEKCKKILEKLGLNFDLLDLDVNVLLEKVFSNQDLVGTFVVRQPEVEQLSIQQLDELKTLQKSNADLQSANATLQVDVSTLTSKINSLQAQQTALQLANSQLVAEKEDLSKLNEGFISKHDTLLHDQVTIRTLYEQLNAEYEELTKEQEQLKKNNRDLRIEVRTLNESSTSHEKKIATLELEKEALKNESKSLGNLRTEHSKLKDDFRNLFTANDRLKTEYKAMQEEIKNLKSESWRLRLGNSEMQGELNTRSDVVGTLQLENAKLRQHCDILLDMNHNLDTDRRALMDHVSKLLSQYHSLLMHSLEDKQHYHMEEKHFTDKLNNLCRQKEKLEEKIMEHYRKLDNASGKKRGFGATLARRVRRATEALNKLPNRHRRSWHEDTIRLTQSGDSGGNDSDSTAEEKPQPTLQHEALKRVPGNVGSLKPRDEIALRRSHRDLSSHRNSIAGDQVGPLSLGSVGTRRTVYLSEDDPNTSTPQGNAVTSSANTGGTNTPTNNGSGGGNPPLLVYNRISTVIGAQAAPSTTTTNEQQEKSKVNNTTPSAGELRTSENNAKENAIWYEYGCV